MNARTTVLAALAILTITVAGFAQVKWDQAIEDVIGGRRSSSDALSVAQSAIETEVRRLGG